MTNLFVSIGAATLETIEKFGRASVFLWRIFSVFPAMLARVRIWLRSFYFVGVKSLTIILMSGIFVGMVIGLVGYVTLAKFAAEQSLGVIVALLLVRELGPVLTALLFAGRAGSAVSAEIGLMKTTEQLAAMEMMAIDPMRHIVAPRFFVGVLSVPLLAALFSMVGIFGGYLVGVVWLGIDNGAFWSQMQSTVNWGDDIMSGVIKSMVFGFVISWIATFEGYDSIPTSEGLSSSTTRTVVNSSLAILCLDFILTMLMLKL